MHETHFITLRLRQSLCRVTAKNSQLFQSKLDPQESCPCNTPVLFMIDVPAPLTREFCDHPLSCEWGLRIQMRGPKQQQGIRQIAKCDSRPSWQEEGQVPHLKLLVEEAHGGDPGRDDGQEGGSNDGHGALYAAQAQQQRLSNPASTCTITSIQLTHR